MTVALLFILMVLPGADRRVDETSKEEEKTDKQYDTGHASVKSMSFSHTVGLTHKGFLNVGPAVWADQAGFFKGIIKAKNVTSLRSLYIKAYCEPMVNSS